MTVACLFPAWYTISSSLPGWCQGCLELGAGVRAVWLKMYLRTRKASGINLGQT